MRELIDVFAQHDELKIFHEPLDISLEIAHIAYVEAKKPGGGKALLFTKPMTRVPDPKNPKKIHEKFFETPVFMNIFGSKRRLELILGGEIQDFALKISEFLDFPTQNFLQKLKNFSRLLCMIPKKRLFRAKDREILNSLYDLPALKTWPHDAGMFITMGQVYTRSLDGRKKNLGMYRLQIASGRELLLHWQIHKDATHFFHEYAAADTLMPVSIGLGGDALLAFAAQAPLPFGIYELPLFAFLKNKRTILQKCLTNDLFLPADLDFVIEGFVDPKRMAIEGPFGDHTGFYTPAEPYPVMQVTAITRKKQAIFPATVVGKPPIEDKFMGALIEQLFLPILQKNAFGLLDFHMPENGVFHNLLLVKFQATYPAHGEQLLSLLWGSGQLSFAKHVILVPESAPSLRDYDALTRWILPRFRPKDIIFMSGVCDALDHAARTFAKSGKMAAIINETPEIPQKIALDPKNLLKKIQNFMPEAVILHMILPDVNAGICVIGVRKNRRIFSALPEFSEFLAHLKIVVFVDAEKNDLTNFYMLLWRVVNNIDVAFDAKVVENTLFLDATDKNSIDDFTRIWPLETDCDAEVLKNLRAKNLITDENFRRFHVDKSYATDHENA